MAVPSRKHLMKFAWEIEAVVGTYETPDIQPGEVTFDINQSFDLVPDESNIGEAFMGLPLQGNQNIGGTMEVQVDTATITEGLEAGMGSKSGTVFDCPTDENTKSISVAALDEVKNKEYPGLHIASFTMTSEAGGKLMYNGTFVGFKAETRNATSNFPTIVTTASQIMLHRHADATGSGYMRLGDQANALAAGDNLNFESVEFGINWQFNNQHANAQLPLVPLSGGDGRPVATFNAKVSRHDTDTILGFRDARTPLQAELFYHVSATKNIKVQIPNFVLDESTVTQNDDVPGEEFTAFVARNGIGSSYDNSGNGMDFNSPIRITVVNS